MSLAVVIICLLWLCCLGTGVYLLLARRRRVASAPSCGHCGYNLTGAPGNRCPECGKLFIETGVHVGTRGRSRRQVWIGGCLMALSLVVTPCIAGFMFTRAQAQRAAQAQVRAQMTAQLLQQQLQRTQTQRQQLLLTAQAQLRTIQDPRVRAALEASIEQALQALSTEAADDETPEEPTDTANAEP